MEYRKAKPKSLVALTAGVIAATITVPGLLATAQANPRREMTYQSKIEKIVKFLEIKGKENPVGNIKGNQLKYGLYQAKLVQKESNGKKVFGILLYEPGSLPLLSSPKICMVDYSSNGYGQVDEISVKIQNGTKESYKDLKLKWSSREEAWRKEAWTEVMQVIVDRFYDLNKEEIERVDQVLSENKFLEWMIDLIQKN